MPEPNGIEAMMTRMLESQIQLAQNLVLMDTRHHETILRIDQKFERIEQKFERIDQRFERLEERMTRIEQKIDALPEEVYRKQIGFQQQS
ncbi:MAG: hypothetical protein OXH92_21830 [Bryobacterales bacterium]|nr:hypothetical protein [Bryobacterales bacterium]